MRRFLAAGGGGEPSSSSSSGPHGERAGSKQAAAGPRYGGGDISLGRGHDLHSQFHSGGGGGGEAEMKDGMDMLARHSSSPAGFFSNLMVDNDSSVPEEFPDPSTEAYQNVNEVTEEESGTAEFYKEEYFEDQAN